MSSETSVTCMMKSNIVYQITFPFCKVQLSGIKMLLFLVSGCSVKQHFCQYNVTLCDDDIMILRGKNPEDQLFTLVAMVQHDI